MMMLKKILIALLLIGLCSGAATAEKSDKELDYLGLAALLIKDGHYARAIITLEEVDLTDEALDKIRYYTLKGLAELNMRSYTAAITAFERAIEVGQSAPLVNIYLAQAYYGAKDYPSALKQIDNAGEKALQMPGIIMLKAQLHWELQQPQLSWQALQLGEQRFPDNGQFMRRQVFILISLELYQQAAAKGLEYVAHFTVAVDDYVAIGEALRASGQATAALSFLEPARISKPGDVNVLLALSRSYVDLGRIHTAAGLMEQAAMQDEKYLTDAAELYRRAGKLLRASYLNEQATDQEKKLKQRLALLLEQQAFHKVEAMEDALYRNGILQDQNIRYALAYAAYKNSHYDIADRHLSYITQPKLFQRAITLRKAMENCRAEQWLCI